MNRQEYDAIMQAIYENGRVTDQDGISEDTEFHFEAKQRGFSDEEIQAAREKYS
jgi:hypothetical protein